VAFHLELLNPKSVSSRRTMADGINDSETELGTELLVQ
jgi:hypothetical protein